MDKTFKRVTRAFSCSDWSLNGRLLALAGHGAIDIYDTNSGELVYQFRSERRRVTKLRFSPSGDILCILMTEEDDWSDKLELWSVQVSTGHENCLAIGLHSVAEAELSFSADGSVIGAYLVTHWQGREKASVVLVTQNGSPITCTSKALAETKVNAFSIDENGPDQSVIVWSYQNVQRWTLTPSQELKSDEITNSPHWLGWSSRSHPGSSTIAFFEFNEQNIGLWNHETKELWTEKRSPQTEERRHLCKLFCDLGGKSWIGLGGSSYLDEPRWLEFRAPNMKPSFIEVGHVSYCEVSPTAEKIFLAKKDGTLEIITPDGKVVLDLSSSVKKAARLQAPRGIFNISTKLLQSRHNQMKKLLTAFFDKTACDAYCNWLSSLSIPLWDQVAAACREPENDTAMTIAFASSALGDEMIASADGGLLRLRPQHAYIPYEKHNELLELFSHRAMRHVQGLDLFFDELCFEAGHSDVYAKSLAESENAKSLLELAFCGTGLTSKGLSKLVTSQNLQELRQLCVSWEAIGISAYWKLAKNLPHLMSLTLDFCFAGKEMDRAIKAFGKANWAKNLLWLDLSGNMLKDEAMKHIVSTPLIEGLKGLRIGKSEGGNNLKDGAAEQLANCKNAKSLLFLDLQECDFSAAGVSLLLDSKNLSNVRVLNLGGLGLSAKVRDVPFDIVEPLVAAKSWGNIRALILPWNELSASSAEKLAQCPHLAQLEYLDLSWNKLKEDGVRAILNSPYIETIDHFDLNGNGFKDKKLVTKKKPEGQWWYQLPRDLVGKLRYLRLLEEN